LAKHPEFQEYFVHYPVKTSPHSSHEFVRKAIGTGYDVLDVGCGEAFLAAQFQKAGNRVWGVDFLPEAAHADDIEGYAQADLDQGLEPYPPVLQGRQFDKILLLDVLEHLRRPEKLLADCLPLLRSNGQLIVSVPNVVNISVRLMMLLGTFNYTERGILDRTHVRFFTRKSARELLQNNGYEVVEQKMTIIPAELALAMSQKHPVVRVAQAALILLTAVFPGLFGYQSFLTARKRGANPQ
jgi:2-polyprenyl-3-methyl-5-hydroxy-6-metoxy-1,4-benzoquinol methylase